ncbi:hypothetical protein ACEV7P_00770 [Vibrio parahaemolyticus]|nr:hypothetical protein [Vibrio parahaemolyticus]MDF4351821.1 hypothetical protein [Vibrio parahaemolyticus]MDG3411172.1 hypothetical protein [Vibrio parahaemolyticus]
MLRNKPIAYLANNRYVFIGTEYYFSNAVRFLVNVTAHSIV